jgi:hypothetical protein
MASSIKEVDGYIFVKSDCIILLFIACHSSIQSLWSTVFLKYNPSHSRYPLFGAASLTARYSE